MTIFPLQLSFISSVVSGFFGFYLGNRTIFFVLFLMVFAGFFGIAYISYSLIDSQTIVLMHLFNWSFIDVFVINFGFLFDNLTAFMLFVVMVISGLVHYYSVSYMSSDPFISRFFSFLSLFSFFMIFLVISNNYLQMFIGWEGVGVCSFLLISFWTTRVLAVKAGLKAMIMNRIADLFFSFGVILILNSFGTTDFLNVFLFNQYVLDQYIILLNFTFNNNDIICLFLLIAAVGKSAQIGLHTWLPDAMEGPTPVSSLLHAATMVTAGVFLLLRSSYLLEYSEFSLFLIYIIGSFSSIFAALIATFQFDIKKVIAYSTFSQIGYMFISCGLSNYSLAFFHLFNHAFFKALLFLSAGSVIHALSDEQDMRKMGGLNYFLPFTYFAFVVGSLAIMGFPFLTGFYSKDILLESIYVNIYIDSFFIYFLAIFAAFLTSFYSFRLLLFVFLNYAHGFRITFSSHECDFYMFLSLFVLIFYSIFIGYFFSDFFFGWGVTTWSNVFLLNKYTSYFIELLPFTIKNIPLFVSFFGIYLNYILFYILDFYKPLNKFWFYFYNLQIFFNNAAFFNLIYNLKYIYLFNFSYFYFTKVLDKYFFELIGPYGVYLTISYLYSFIRSYQFSIIFLVIGSMFFCILFILLIIIFL